MSLKDNEAQLQQWIGRTETTVDVLGAGPARAMAAVLDKEDFQPRQGAPLPPLWHWLYFLPATPQTALGEDGHARPGGFLPPLALPQRMWAAGKLEFEDPLHIGQTVTRQSTIKNVTIKQGRSGQLAFVELEHQYQVRDRRCLLEMQTLVYREAGRSGATARNESASEPPSFRCQYKADITWLFRYSALTFNAHRIHYDRDYATRVGQYPGLVVHGPLIATLMLDLFCTQYPDRRLKHFEFRAQAPLFDQQPFSVCGRSPDKHGESSLWAENAEQQLCMKGRATVE